jgi:diadenosine tetraphosphate (Ap4A) HIT family hydrolase
VAFAQVSSVSATACPLCDEPGGELIWQDDFARVVLVDDADHPGFLRVIVREHVREWSDLAPPDRHRLLDLALACEAVQRRILSPHKMNVASLGNMVPHVHVHVIPRFAGDAHFPQPVWGSRGRDEEPSQLAARRARLPALRAALVEALDLLRSG